uniref:subtilisin n=1 Tax=Ditylum brightwellii TaxID=49249 RepID=A0A7S4SZ44_9STRA
MESEMEAEFLDLTEKVGSEAELLAVVKPVWDAANDYELNRAEEEELSSGKPYPYIVCHRGSAAGMSTNKRKKAVKERLMAAAVAAKNFSEEEATEYVQNINYATMAVKDDLFCGVTRLHASIACEISDESNSISVQPMIMSLKMAADTVGTILDRMADTALQFEGDPNVDFTLCPGATTDAKFAEKDITTTMGGGDVTEEFIAFLLDRGENFSCADPNITSAASSALYWTDPASPTLTEQVSITKRTIYWAELFDRSLNTCNCDDMYTNRLRATVTEGDPSNPHDPDILNILFMSEGATPSDTDCAIALVAAGALQPEICHVEVQGVVDTGNDIAQWLAQGGVGSEDAMETPLYDAGITGAGQVVAVSDTGLDYENCYFMDANAPDPSAARNDAHRKVVSYNPFVDDADAKNGHGTHVCGIVAGHRSEGGMEQTDGVANGIAYDAKIAFLDIGFPDQSLSLPRRDSDILSTGRGTGDDSKDAHIHSASWGGATNSYTGQARNFDNFMFKNDDFLILVAAGNSGRDGLNSVGTPATAKNILSGG